MVSGDAAKSATQGNLQEAFLGDHVEWNPLDEVREPGAYVCRESGDLLRIPPVGAPVGGDEMKRKIGEQQIFVTRISEDPFVPISTARIRAANMDIDVSF